MAQWIECQPVNQRVAGQVPSRVCVRGNYTFMFFSLSFSLPSPSLKINNKIFKKRMLGEISQAVKDKYHVISPISGTSSTKQTNKQNRIRDLEIKNKLTVTRGEGGGG